MSEVIKTIEPTAEPEVPVQSALDELFAERDNPKKEEKPEVKKTEETEEKALTKAPPKKPIAKESKEIIDEDEDDDESNGELNQLKQELEKTKKALSENQKWGRTNSQKLKSALKKVQAFISEGAFTEEEAKDMLTLLESEAGEETPDSSENLNPVQIVFKVANQELENIRAYTEDALLDKKVRAFDFFLNTAPREEVREALEELMELQASPIKLARRMLAIGEGYYEEVYKDFEESGGFKNFANDKKNELEKLRKKIDKLQNKLSQYEEYDPSTFRIEELSDSDALQKVAAKSGIDELFEERDQVRRR